MVTSVVEKSINWQAPSVDDSEISVEDYRAMVNKAENSGYMSYETLQKHSVALCAPSVALCVIIN